MRKTIGLAYFIFLSLFALSQTDSIFHIPDNALSWYSKIENTDSLKRLLMTSTPREQVHILCELAYSFLPSRPDDAYNYTSRALHLADSMNYNNGKVMAYMLLASSYMPGYDTIKGIRLLQKAEKYFDEETHWTMKSRIWSGIGYRMGDYNMQDSSVYYYQKILTELDADEAWLSHIWAYYRLSNYAQINQDYKTERKYLEKNRELLFSHPEYTLFYDNRSFFGYLERLSKFYTLHGNYKQSVAASQRAFDSIAAILPPTATSKVYQAKFLGKIGRTYHHWGKYDSAIKYHDSAIYYFNKVWHENYEDIADNSTYPTLQEWNINMANQLEEKAGVLIKTGNFEKAETDLLKSVKMRTEYHDPLGVAMSFDKLGELRAMQGEFGEAVQYYDSALWMKTDFLERFRKQKGEISATFWSGITNESISYTYLMMGELYDLWHKKNLSRDKIQKSLALSREIGYQKGEAEALTALGTIYLTGEHKDSARIFFKQAQTIYRSMEHLPGTGILLGKTGDYYLATGKSNAAMKNYNEALRLFKSLEMPRDRAEILVKQASIYQSRKEWNQAIEKYKAGLEIADRLDLRQLQMNGHYNLSEIYTNLNQPANAFNHYKKYTGFKDEIYSQETKRQIAEIETRFETEKKEQHILLLEKENHLYLDRELRSRFFLIGLGSFVFVLILLALLYLRLNKLKAQQEKVNLQQRLLRSQMNPHFIFNSLASVQNAIINDQPEIANRYLSRFSKLMRNILESSSMEIIKLDEELTTIDNYLALQKIRFSEKFEYSISVDENIDTDNIHIPPMLTQPFIENAIEHGFKHKAAKGHIEIRFALLKKVLVIEIKDDGIGRQEAGRLKQKGPNDYKSMATHITRQRIRALNKGRKRKITMEITDLKDDSGKALGTLVRFEIPV